MRNFIIAIAATVFAPSLIACMPTDIEYDDLGGDCERLTKPDYLIDTKAKANGLSLGEYCIDNTLIIRDSEFTDFTAFDGLVEVGTLHIIGNTQLQSLEGFDRLRVKKEIIIEDNENLAIIDDKSLVLDTKLEGDLIIRGNASLEDLSAVRKVREVAGNLSYIDNGGLTSLKDFEEISQLEGSLTIRGNSSLTSVEGFGSLSGTGGNLIFDNNSALRIIDGFTLSLGFVGGDLTVTNNKALSDTSALQLNIDSVGGAIRVVDNIGLSDCRADEFSDIPGDAPLVVTPNSGVWEPCYE